MQGQQEQQTQQGRKRRGAPEQAVEEYECAVCLSLLCSPVVAPCGHDMCQHCYQRWASTSVCGTVCPLCRCALPSNLAVCLRLKKTIERLHPEASAKRRQEVAMQLAAEQPKPADESVQLPTYPQGPFPPHLLAQWATAAAQQQTFFNTTLAAMFMGAMQQVSMHNSAPATLQTFSPEGVCTANTSCSAINHVIQSAQGGTPDPPVEGAPAQQPVACRREAWQSAADSPMRLQVARAIIETLQQKSWHLMLGHKLADAVRLLELVLYRTAATREAYMDRSDLAHRIVAAVQQRAAAAAARRSRLEATATSAEVVATSACPAEQQQGQQQQQQLQQVILPALPV